MCIHAYVESIFVGQHDSRDIGVACVCVAVSSEDADAR